MSSSTFGRVNREEESGSGRRYQLELKVAVNGFAALVE